MAGKFSMNDLLNKQSKVAPGGTEAYFITREIPINRIKPSPQNKYSVHDVEELAASIEAMGLLHNIVVKEPDGEGFYELISGERRFRACTLLYEGGNARYRTIPCKVEANGSPAETELKLLYANATARVLSDYEKTMQAVWIKEALQARKAEGHVFKGRMREIAADILKVSPAQMGRMESINKNLSPECMEEFKTGGIGITAAYELSTMSVDTQADALERYKETGSILEPKPSPATTAADDSESITKTQSADVRDRFMESMGRQPAAPPTVEQNAPKQATHKTVHSEADTPGGAQAITAHVLDTSSEEDYSGLKVKYRVFKAKDNTPVENCFVLRPDKDGAARAALRTYAETTENAQLAADIKAWLEALED